MALSRFVLPFADVGAGIRPSSGAKLFFYATGTSTPKSTFTDATGSTANTNPVIANANGVFPAIFFNGSFNVALKDSNNVQIWTADPVNSKEVGTIYATTLDLIASEQASSANDIVESQGYTAKGDGGGAQWKQNGVTGQTASQSPAQLGDALLNDANGNQWGLVFYDSGVNGSALGILVDGSDTTLAFQAAVNHTVLSFSRSRNPKLNLPVGKLIFSQIIINAADSGSSKTNGRIIISGAGRINTNLVCNSDSLDAILIKSGKVNLNNFTVSSDGVSRSKTLGAGAGIKIDSTDGVNPDSVTIAKFNFYEIQVINQPGNGFDFINTELLDIANCASEDNGGHGYSYNGDNYGGDLKGITNISTNCRARVNAGKGFNVLSMSECTFINLQSLSNDDADEFFSNGRGTILINPDIEGGTGALLTNGAKLAGLGSGIIGGLISNVENGIVLTGEGQFVTRPHFTNSGASFPMAVAVTTTSATNYDVNLSRHDYTSQNITKTLQPSAVHAGGMQFEGKFQSFSTSIGGQNSFTVTNSTPFSFGDDGLGSVGSSIYFVTLESNALITIPTTFKNGQEFTIVFKQDSTGSRALTFSGSNWIETNSSTGNSANTYSTFKFQIIEDQSFNSFFVQIGAQMPWVV
jgi:hypothetical protein